MKAVETDLRGARLELLAAAQAEFVVESYEQVGLRQIAARAGLDTARLSREFGSKEQLLLACLDDALIDADDASADWLSDVAAELAGERPILITAPFRIILSSVSSPGVEASVRARVPALLNSIEPHLRPSAPPGIKATLVAAAVFGVVLARDILKLEPHGEQRRICLSLITNLLQAIDRPAADAQDPRQPSRKSVPRPFGVPETKAAILAAADAEFSRHGYAHASLRGIASVANADPSLIIRYFGSKEDLFREVLSVHFVSPKDFERQNQASRLANSAFADLANRGSPLDITLRSASSPVAREILKQDIEERFIKRMAENQDDASGAGKGQLNALMISTLFLGSQFCNSILHMPAIRAHRAEATQRLTAAFRAVQDAELG